MAQAFFHHLDDHAGRRPNADAIVAVGAEGRVNRRVTYGELRSLIGSCAAELGGAPAAEPDVLALPNGLEYVVRFLGALRAGRAVFPMHPATPPAEREEMRETVLRQGDVTGSLILRSSGTTGLPKLVRRDGPSLDAVAANVAAATGLSERDRVLAVIPQCHSYGIESALLAPLWAGAAVHVCESFDPATVLRQWREGVTVMPAVPFMLEVLGAVGEAGDSECLRLIYSAGAPLPGTVFDAFRDRHGVSIGQLYGATEMGSVTFGHPEQAGFDPAGVGVPMEGVEIRILDSRDSSIRQPLPTGSEGQVAVRAPSMLTAYIGPGGEPLPDGFFLTGDLGRVDDLGRLTLTARLKLLIDVGGMKVNPLEVETVLAAHPAVRECVVVPVPQSATVVRLKAILVSRNGPIDTEELKRFARGRLAGYKVPRTFEVVGRLPRSATGKVQRRELIEASR